jgi:hypothetical protein
MTRLPVVAGDSNAWGTILNAFLGVAHNADGTLKNRPINLKDTCAIDGVTDDSVPFTAAYTLAASLGVGLYMPGGTLVKGNDTLLPNVSIDLGGGTIKLKNGANTDLFSAQTGNINLSAAIGSGVVGTLSNFSIQNGVLDGNKANQSSGPSYCLRFYGYFFSLRNLVVKNGFSGDALIDWNGGAGITQPSDEMESIIDTVKFHDGNGIGLQMGGPHDTRINNVLSFNQGSHGFHFAPNMAGALCSQIHPWGLTQSVGAVGCLAEAPGMQFVNCMFEGSDTAQFVALANDIGIHGGVIFGNTGYAGTGLQVGQAAGGTPIPGQINQSGGVKTAVSVTGLYAVTKFLGNVGGAINEVNVGFNTYLGQVYQTSGTAIASNGGYPSGNSTMLLSVTGLAIDGTPGHGGTFQLNTKSYNGIISSGETGDFIFALNTRTKANGGGFQIVNGYPFTGFSDGGTTTKYSFDASTGNILSLGNLSTGQSATAPDPGASGTVATANVGEARVNPSGASRAGCILASGTIAGQEVWVVNENATNTISWATQATSHIAGEAGGTFVLAANRIQHFKWNSSTSLWYKTT